MQLDYFAILPQYQGKGYGSNAIKLLKELYKNYDGIFIEIEKVGNGNTVQENEIRQRRAKFYENLGFCELEFGLNLYTVIYSTYILPCLKNTFSDEEVMKNILEIYNAILGEQNVKKNLQVILSEHY